jgi:ribosome-associated protein
MAREKTETPKAEALAREVVQVLNDGKGQSIQCLDVRHLTTMMDYMVIVTGRSDRHVRALAEALIDKGKANHWPLLGQEGQDAGEWILVDLADVVVHVMQPRTREFYELEKLWDISRPEGDADRSRLGIQ